jgi:radical SAM protein with 4Fe4S-binding SPASM domain
MALPPVRTITWELTHRCHRRCAFCYVKEPAAQEGQAGLMAAAVAGLVRATGCAQVQLSGGEPLLHPELLRVIDVLRDAGAQVSMITDGAHLTTGLARELASRKVGPLQPTLLSGEPGLHDTLRGNGAFQDATRAIATAAAAGIDVVACMVITRANWAEAARVAELAFALGARAMALSRLCPAAGARAAYDTLMPDALQVRGAAQSAARICRRLGFPLSAAVTIPRCVWDDASRPPLRVGVCSLVGPRSSVTVGPDGSIRSCSLSTRIWGNVLAEPWEGIARRLWENELAPLREAIPERCRDCPWWQRCLGGCRLSALAVFGDGSRPDPLAPCAHDPA